MKTVLLLLASGVCVLLFGCASNGFHDISPRWHETRALSESYQVVNGQALGVGYVHQISLFIIPPFCWGGSFEAARTDMIEKNPGTEDVINVRSDVTGVDFIFYQRYHVNLHGAAIKYTSGGNGNPDKVPAEKTTK